MVNQNLMEKFMEKIQHKLIELINNGYGISQAMDKLGLEQKEVVKLIETDAELCSKLHKRFKGTKWIDETNFKGAVVELPTGDTPELAALKAEAKELGVEFNPQIGYDKLKKRVEEFKAAN